MKLDRNVNSDGRGKYALVKMRELTKLEGEKDFSATCAVESLHERGVVDYGDTDNTEFFVIRLKDKYADKALTAYADAASLDGHAEYAAEIMELALKARKHPNKKKPD